MASLNLMLNEFAWSEEYRVQDMEEILTPALVIYPEIVAHNIACTLRLAGGDANRWRPHIKTAKLELTVRMLVERGVQNLKCATTLELLVACRAGAADVLVAYPMVGANARRVREIAEEFPGARISVLVESEEQARQWHGSRIGVFLDVNPGMNRTGVEQNQAKDVIALVRRMREAGAAFRGLHYYDGQYGGFEEPARTAATYEGYAQLLRLVAGIEESGTKVEEVVTAGTPTFPCSLSYDGFRGKDFVHRISPGTVVYNDATSLAQLPAEFGYRPAALVMMRAVSRPCGNMVTCDAGHKTVSADAGVPTCVAVGHRELTPLSPSEEHLPMEVAAGAKEPEIGEVLYLLPRHICPTVNNFDYAVVARKGRVESVEKVSARGREAPLFAAASKTGGN